MRKIANHFKLFSVFERALFSGSLLLILASFLLFDRTNYLALTASLVGAASLIYCAKGNPAGQMLMILFSILYGIISHTFRYYGEMITYLGLSLPMAVLSLITWLRHPFHGNRAQVTVNRLRKWELLLLVPLTLLVTGAFYFVLKALSTANLIPSTVSVATSFAAAYLTFRRSPYYALAYAANDAVLILLWVLAALQNPAYVSVVVCFIVFLVNDVYGMLSWRAMQKHQQKAGT